MTNDNTYMARVIERRFKGKKELVSNYIPKCPESCDREYYRLVNEYMRIMKKELENELPKLKDVYKYNRDRDVRMDADDKPKDLITSLTDIFNRIQNSITVRSENFALRERIKKLALLNRKLSVNEWKKCVKLTLGVDIREDYYYGDFYEQGMREWISDNVDLIKTMPSRTLSKVKDVVYNDYNNGVTTTNMLKDIQRVYMIDKRHARFIARDQVAKLNGRLMQEQQKRANITKYQWDTSGDERVRKSHRELDGKTFDWSEPPRNSDGRCCHPGEDFQCRCVALAIFDDEVDLPIVPDSSEPAFSNYINLSDYSQVVGITNDVPNTKLSDFEIAYKFLPKYTDEEIYRMGDIAKDLSDKHINIDSMWSGKININKGSKLWQKPKSCDIDVDNKVSQSMILHEMLHSKSISLYGLDVIDEVFITWHNIEEATVQLMTEEICIKEGIDISGTEYRHMVDNLKVLNRKYKIANSDYDFAKMLIETKVADRYDWLQTVVSNSIMSRPNDIVEINKAYNEADKLMEVFKGVFE